MATIKLWTGSVEEHPGLSVEQLLKLKYPEFENTDQTDEGWYAYDDDTINIIRVYNEHGDHCATLTQ